MSVIVRNLGASEASQMSVHLIRTDLARLWLVGLIFQCVNFAPIGLAKLLAAVTCDGRISEWQPLWSTPWQMLVAMPAMAGLMFAVGRKIDGHAARPTDVFQAFRSCYWPSVVAGLPVVLLTGLMYVVFTILGVTPSPRGQSAPAALDGTASVLGSCCGLLVFFLVALLVIFLVVFTAVAVWDTPHSGLGAIRSSVRMVTGHFGSTLAAIALWLAACVGVTAPGWISLLVGAGVKSRYPWAEGVGVAVYEVVLFLVMPLLSVWLGAILIYLYRSWSGRLELQPFTSAKPPETPAPPEGALPA